MGYIGSMSIRIYPRKGKARCTADEVLESPGFTGEWVTPAGPENEARREENRVKVAREGMTVFATPTEALAEARKRYGIR